MSSNTLTLKITASVTALQAALKQAESSVKAFNSGFNKKIRNNAADMSNAFNSASKTIESTLKRVGAVALGGSFGLAAFTKSASELQSLRASFESLTGTVENTNTVMNTLYQYGKETAFDNASIQASAKMFLANGVAVQDLMGWMRTLGDVAGATGADLKGLALPLTQAIGSGKMMTQDWYQMINQGAGGLQKYIIAALGAGHSVATFKNDLEKGRVTIDVMRKALQMASAEGGMAFQGALKQSQTFNGRMSNLIETITNVGLSIIGVDAATGQVQAGGVFDKISKAVENATTWLEDNRETINKVANTIINNLVPAITALGSAWAIMKIGGGITSAIQRVDEYKKKIIGATSAFKIFSVALTGNPLMLFAVTIATVVSALTFLQIKFNIFGKAAEWIKNTWNTTFESISNWINNVKGAIGGIYNAIKEWIIDKIEGVKKTAEDVYNNVAKWINDNKQLLINIGIIIGTIILPKLVQVGIQAVIAFSKMATQAVVTGARMATQGVIGFATWISKAAIAGAIGVKNFAIMGAKAIWAGGVMAAQGAIAFGKWIAGSVMMGAKAVATFVMMGAQALIAGAKIAASWIMAMGPLGAVIAVVAGVVALIIANWQTVSKRFSDFWSRISKWFSDIWKGASDTFGKIANFVGNVVNKIGGFFNKVRETVINVFDNIVGFLAKWGPTLLAIIFFPISILVGLFFMFKDQIFAVFSAIGKFIGDAFTFAVAIITTVWSGVVAFFTGIWNGIVEVFSAVASWLGGIFSEAWNAIVSVWNGVVAWFSGVWNGIVGIFSAVATWFGNMFKSAWDAIVAIWNGAIAWFKAVWDGIVGIFNGVANWFGEIFQKAWDGVVNIWNGAVGFFTGVWDGIVKVFSIVGAWFSDMFQKAYNGIVNVFSGLGSFFQGVWNTITGIFSKIGIAISDAITGAVKTAVNSVLGFATGAINTFIRLINGAIDIINHIPGVSIPKIGELQVPKLATGGIVTPQNGGSIIYAGDGGQNEWVIPESKMASLVGQINQRLGSSNNNNTGGSGNNINITVNVEAKSNSFTDEDAVNIAQKINRALKAQGLRLDQLGALR